MSNSVLIIGASGTGKSTSLRNLNHEETFIISVLDKPLPFKGYKSKYKAINPPDHMSGNIFYSSNWDEIIKCIEFVNRNEKFKNLIIDDFNYVV